MIAMLFNFILVLSISSLFTTISTEKLTLPCVQSAALDIVFVLDTTTSMQASKTNIQKKLPQLMEEFQEVFSSTKFGIVVFNDEPTICQSRFRYKHHNFCPRVDCDLTRKSETVKRALKNYDPNNGDYVRPEDAMGALLVTALNPKVDWRSKDKSDHFRIAILITDADYRFPGDVSHGRLCPPQQGLRPNDGDGKYDCAIEDYPTVDQVKDILEREKIIPLFLLFNDGDGYNPVLSYETLIRQWNIGGRAVSQKDASNLVDVVTDAVEKVVCTTTTTTRTTITTTTTATSITTTTTATAITTTTTARAITTTTINTATVTAKTSTPSPSITNTTSAAMVTKSQYLTPIVLGAAGSVLVGSIAIGSVYSTHQNRKQPVIMDGVFDDWEGQAPSSEEKDMATSFQESEFL